MGAPWTCEVIEQRVVLSTPEIAAVLDGDATVSQGETLKATAARGIKGASNILPAPGRSIATMIPNCKG
jgi:hypothetical protein